MLDTLTVIIAVVGSAGITGLVVALIIVEQINKAKKDIYSARALSCTNPKCKRRNTIDEETTKTLHRVGEEAYKRKDVRPKQRHWFHLKPVEQYNTIEDNGGAVYLLFEELMFCFKAPTDAISANCFAEAADGRGGMEFKYRDGNCERHYADELPQTCKIDKVRGCNYNKCNNCSIRDKETVKEIADVIVQPTDIMEELTPPEPTVQSKTSEKPVNRFDGDPLCHRCCGNKVCSTVDETTTDCFKFSMLDHTPEEEVTQENITAAENNKIEGFIKAYVGNLTDMGYSSKEIKECKIVKREDSIIILHPNHKPIKISDGKMEFIEATESEVAALQVVVEKLCNTCKHDTPHNTICIPCSKYDKWEANTNQVKE